MMNPPSDRRKIAEKPRFCRTGRNMSRSQKESNQDEENALFYHFSLAKYNNGVDTISTVLSGR
jgi:hypothetical protein